MPDSWILAGVKGRVVVAVAALGLGCGPAKPILIYVPPTIAIDTARSARRATKIVTPSKTFWEAMSSLDTEYVSKHEVTDSQREFARAISLVMSGRHDDASVILDGIRATATDTLVSGASRVLLTAMLQYRDRWKTLAELDSIGRRGRSRIAEADKAGVETWSAAFRNVPDREISFPAKPVVVPLLVSASGTPMIQLTINGKPHIFWLDTGSSMSIVSSAVAAECGVVPLLPDTLEVATTTGRVPAQAGAIARLDLGGIHISNSTTLIVATDRMQVRIGDNRELPMVAQIEGVIGFDIISRLDLRIDYVNRRVTMARPEANPRIPRTGRNLFWLGTPIVRLVTSRGIPLHFNLDTGAQETYSTEGLVMKTKARTFLGERRLVGGLAGITIVHGRFVDQLSATMAGQPLILRRLLVFAPAVASFVALDGIMGSDVGRGGVVRIDATNGLFLLGTQPGR